MGKKFSILTCLFYLILTNGYSQSVKELLDKGDRFLNKKNYKEALQWYSQAFDMAPGAAEVNFRVGLAYLNTEKKAKSLPYLEKAYHIKPEVDEDIDYHLGLSYQANHEYRKAKKHFEDFKIKNKKLSDIANHKINECVIADSLMQHPIYVEIENIGSVINSNFHEYSPIVTSDGKSMIFTTNRTDDDTKIKTGTNYEDIYISHKSGDSWTTPQRISENINIKYNDAAASLSADGKTLFLYYEEGNGDIYISIEENGVWSTPMPLNKNINTPLYWETSACISSDGKKLFFTSSRPGGKGELDIYVSELDAQGNWGKAANLGPTINTYGNEDSPFIHPDGVTLYFSSDGHPTMGSNDIFKSELKNGEWSKPVNLGYPINSIDYDGFFSISSDKKNGYYSTLREDGFGDSDIYKVKFLDPPKPIEPPVLFASTGPHPPQPTKEETKTEEFVDPLVLMQRDLKVVTVLKGKVIDEHSGSPLGAVISLVDNETHRTVSKINSNTTSGEFELVVPHGGNYGVTTERGGYLFNSINFNVPQFAEYQEIDMHIIMVKVEVGSKVVLKNVFFDLGKADLKNESISELNRIYELLLTNQQLKVQINGHTDNTGNSSNNKVLSLQRAERVVKYLIDKGIDTNRVSAKGYGSERPLVSNDDETGGREINRRTEIEIIENAQER